MKNKFSFIAMPGHIIKPENTSEKQLRDDSHCLASFNFPNSISNTAKVINNYNNCDEVEMSSYDSSSEDSVEEPSMPIQGLNTGRWSKKEHLAFLKGIFEYGSKWKKVQNIVKTRNSTQARSHSQKFFMGMFKKLNISLEHPVEDRSQLGLIFNELQKIHLQNFEKVYKSNDTIVKNDKIIKMIINFSKKKNKNKPRVPEKKNMNLPQMKMKATSNKDKQTRYLQ